MNSEFWISIAWGFVLAALRIGIPIFVTELCLPNNKNETEQVSALRDRQIVHYCYGDDLFNKKRFMNENDSLKMVWKACAPEGTVNGAVTKAIREAAVFYDLA